MEKQARSLRQTHVVIRLRVAVLVGLGVVVLVGLTAGWRYAPAVGWIATASVYLGWTWIVVLPMDADQTRNHVGPGDPPRGWVTDVIILSASVASLAGVAHLLAAGSKAGFEKNLAAAVGVVGYCRGVVRCPHGLQRPLCRCLLFELSPRDQLQRTRESAVRGFLLCRIYHRH